MCMFNYHDTDRIYMCYVTGGSKGFLRIARMSTNMLLLRCAESGSDPMYPNIGHVYAGRAYSRCTGGLTIAINL